VTLQSLRKLLFRVFAVLYFVLCPATILYSLGYVRGPRSLKLVQTGTLYVSTVPKGANVYLNGRRYALTTPAAIHGLLPGEYRVTVGRKGNRSWSRPVSIAAGEAVRIVDILLLPDPLRASPLADGAFRGLLGLPETETILAWAGDELGALGMLTAGAATNFTPLVDRASPFRDADVREIYTVPASEQIVLRVRRQRGNHFLVLDASRPSTPPRDVTELIRGSPRSFLWDPDRPEQLLAVYEDHADRIDTEERGLYPRFVADCRGIGVRSGDVYVLTSDHRLLRHDLKDASRPVSLLMEDDRAFTNGVFDAGQRYRVAPLSRRRVALIDEDGALLANVSPFRFAEKGVRGVAYLESKDRVLVWTGQRIGLLDFARVAAERGTPELRASLRWVYSGGRDIVRCFWAFKGAYIVFADRNEVRVLRTPGAGVDSEPAEWALNVERAAAVHVAPRHAMLYFLEEGAARPCGVALAPREAAPVEPPVGETGSARLVKAGRP
jgi:hypothetical protein